MESHPVVWPVSLADFATDLLMRWGNVYSRSKIFIAGKNLQDP
jgi:hypothetical protein